MVACCLQERDAEVQILQQRLAHTEDAHEEELADLQATIQASSAKLQNTKARDLSCSPFQGLHCSHFRVHSFGVVLQLQLHRLQLQVVLW